jgi:hypothetical protein
MDVGKNLSSEFLLRRTPGLISATSRHWFPALLVTPTTATVLCFEQAEDHGNSEHRVKSRGQHEFVRACMQGHAGPRRNGGSASEA